MGKNSFKASLALICVITVTGCKTLQQQANELAQLDPQHFYQTASVKNDSLDTYITVTTHPGFSVKVGLDNQVLNDVFFRGFVDKKTGKASYYVYQKMSYFSTNWRYYRTANYETLNGPQAAKLKVIDRSYTCTVSIGKDCLHTEHVTFPVSKEVLDSQAQRYPKEKGTTFGWRFKFLSKKGVDFNNFMTAAEVKGFLDRMNDIQSGIKK